MGGGRARVHVGVKGNKLRPTRMQVVVAEEKAICNGDK
jgi:hypothetical protein